MTLGAALLLASAATCACGIEDPSSIATRRGALQLAYPEALHVGTAVWQAQLAGTLPRDALARRADLSPEARAKRRLAKAHTLLETLAARLNAGPGVADRPGVAIVLIGPVLWSRLDAGEGTARAHVHIDGPEPGDVVAVTDTAVIEAIAQGRFDFGRAAEGGMLRLYGNPGDVSAAYDWLTLATRR